MKKEENDLEKSSLEKLEEIRRKTKENFVITKSNIERRLEESKAKRLEWIEDAKAKATSFLISFFATTLIIFVILIFITGLTNFIPDNEGVQALKKLFNDIVNNAKTIFLITLGFFFRDYLSRWLKNE